MLGVSSSPKGAVHFFFPQGHCSPSMWRPHLCAELPGRWTDRWQGTPGVWATGPSPQHPQARAPRCHTSTRVCPQGKPAVLSLAQAHSTSFRAVLRPGGRPFCGSVLQSPCPFLRSALPHGRRERASERRRPPVLAHEC